MDSQRESDNQYSEFSKPSKLRLDLAKVIVNSMPESIFVEAAIVGSASWGVADKNSDLDLELWIEESQPIGAIKSWLEERFSGTIYIEENPDREDELIRAAVNEESVWVEIAWRTISFQDGLVKRISSGEDTSREVLINAWNIHHAIPLRSDGHLSRWKETLSAYPEKLTSNIIESTAAFWRLPHRIEMLWTLADRGNLLSLNEWISADIEDGLRVLFAMNRTWEPDWKNLSTALPLLETKPPELRQRIDEIYLEEDLFMRVRKSLKIIQDILELVPAEYDIKLQKANIQNNLDI